MGDQDRNDDGPSLEMPSFSLRRGRRKPTEGEPSQAEHPPPPHPAAGTTTLRSRRRGPRTAREPRQVRLPGLSGVAAAVVTGLVVGLLAVVLTWGVLNGCEVVRGTPSCGGGPGLLLLVAVLALLSWVGGRLLSAFGVEDPGSTSFLGASLMAVLAMLFLADALFAWWMVVAIPLVAAATYALAWWVTSRVGEPA